MAKSEEGFLGISGSRGCCLLFLPALLALVFASFAVGQSLAAPDLGAPPRGPIDGYNQTQLVKKIASDVTSGLKTSPHVTETLSEDDLGVIARALNPNPQQLSDVQVRLRDGLLVISGLAHIGPASVTAVARYEVGLNLTHEGQQFDAQLKNLELGQFIAPSWIQSLLSTQGITPPDVGQLFSSSQLKEVADDVDCAIVTSQGLVVGFHRVGVQAMPQSCHS
jgi:hypothetical protein